MKSAKFNHMGVANVSALKIDLLVNLVVKLVCSSPTVLAPSLAYTVIFIFPSEIVLGVSLFAISWPDLVHEFPDT